MKYDPHEPPKSKAWMALPEQERIDLVLDYHRRKKVKLPNEMLHAAIHVTVETQIILGDTLPVKSKLKQLMKEGLDRHEALHAVGSVLAEYMFGMVSENTEIDDPNILYFEALERLTADSWRQKY